MPIIDKTELQNVIGGDENLLADLAIMFVHSLPDLEARIQVGVDNHAANEIETAARQLRSRISNFGASELKNQAGKLELAARNQEIHRVETLQHKLFADVEQLVVELRSLTKLPLKRETVEN